MNDKEPNKENSNPAQNIKYDENGDEIIWEFNENKSSIAYFISLILAVFWTCLCLGFLFFGSKMAFARVYNNGGFTSLKDFAGFCACIIGFLMFLYMLSIFMKFFNQKRVYATKDYLIHIRHIGKTKKLALGSFFAITGHGIQATATMGTGSLNIICFSSKGYFADLKLMQTYTENNLDDFFELPLLIGKTKATLINLDEKNYKNFLENINSTIGHYFCPEIDLKEIEKLREERIKDEK